MDLYAIFSKIFAPVFSFIWSVVFCAFAFLVSTVGLFLLVFILKYHVWGKGLNSDYLASHVITFPPYNFLRWLLWDILTRKEREANFRAYGFTIFVGRQGAGKTLSMVDYLNRMKKKYPGVIIVTNFWYEQADYRMESWRDLMEIRNGTDGVIFAIDEIHSEYSSANWKDFPESILSEISQQRKQRVKIVATSQVFSRVAKPIREQAFSVVCCSTYFGRITFQKEYDAAEYSTADTPYIVKKKCKPMSRTFCIQSNALRKCYDTYEKIERLVKVDFIPRDERG